MDYDFKDRYLVVKDNIEIDIDLTNLKKKLEKAQSDLIHQIKSDTENYVPFNQGVLSNSARPENNNTELVYDTPYARYMYMGKVVTDERGRTWVGKGERKPIVTNKDLTYSREGHSKAGAKWYERSKEDNLEKWIDTVKKGLK